MPKFLLKDELFSLLLSESPEFIYPDDAGDESYSSADYEALAEVLADVYENLERVYDNKFPQYADAIAIRDWEIKVFGSFLDGSLTLEQRRAALVKFLRTKRTMTRAGIMDIIREQLNPLGIDNEDIEIITWNCGPGGWLLNVSELSYSTILNGSNLVDVWGPAICEDGPLDHDKTQEEWDVMLSEAYTYEVRIFNHTLSSSQMQKLDEELTKREKAGTTHLIIDGLIDDDKEDNDMPNNLDLNTLNLYALASDYTTLTQHAFNTTGIIRNRFQNSNNSKSLVFTADFQNDRGSWLVNGSEKARVDLAGFKFADGNAANPSIAFINAPGNGFYHAPGSDAGRTISLALDGGFVGRFERNHLYYGGNVSESTFHIGKLNQDGTASFGGDQGVGTGGAIRCYGSAHLDFANEIWFLTNNTTRLRIRPRSTGLYTTPANNIRFYLGEGGQSLVHSENNIWGFYNYSQVAGGATGVYRQFESRPSCATGTDTYGHVSAYYGGSGDRRGNTWNYYTTYHGVVPTAATNNAFISNSSVYTGNYFIHQSGSDPSVFSAQVRVASLGVGNTEAATGAVGNTVRKMEVFNASGTSLGYVAIYDDVAA